MMFTSLANVQHVWIRGPAPSPRSAPFSSRGVQAKTSMPAAIHHRLEQSQALGQAAIARRVPNTLTGTSRKQVQQIANILSIVSNCCNLWLHQNQTKTEKQFSYRALVLLGKAAQRRWQRQATCRIISLAKRNSPGRELITLK